MTLRQLDEMARSKREFAGDLVEFFLRFVGPAVWCPGELPARLNPWKEESEAMKEHRKKLALARLSMG